jgi:hypothetical protein
MPQDHPVFQEPADRGVKIWRYIDLTRFLSLLEDRALYFARADQLGDAFEGSFPKTNREQRPVRYKEIIEKYEEKKLSVTFPGGACRTSFLEIQAFIHEWLCQWTFVNCWHINDSESAAMWRLYGLSRPG